MNEKRFTLLDETIFDNEKQAEDGGRVTYWVVSYGQRQRLVGLLNEQQATIHSLKEEVRLLKPTNIEQYEQIVQLQKENEQLKGENERLRLELETHKHLLWSTREAEKKVNKLADSLADEVKKNGLLNEELNQLRIENMRLKKKKRRMMIIPLN